MVVRRQGKAKAAQASAPVAARGILTRINPEGLTALRQLALDREKLVEKAMKGDNWCIGQIGDRLDGKPKERQEHEGVVDHAIRIIREGMPPIGNEGSDSRSEGSIPATINEWPNVTGYGLLARARDESRR